MDQQTQGVGRYRSILADPPWRYDSDLTSEEGAKMECPYPSMSDEEIIALPVSSWAASEAMLFLWTTNAHMPVAVKCVEAWGFEHRTIVTWDKQRSSAGAWLKGQTEHLLVAKRGKVAPPNLTKVGTHWTTLLREKRRGHSQKPRIAYALVEDLGLPPRLELFARHHREGWEVWGNQAPRATQMLLVTP
jgi:N6-adenosine-specific RNA methylase IME4